MKASVVSLLVIFQMLIRTVMIHNNITSIEILIFCCFIMRFPFKYMQNTFLHLQELTFYDFQRKIMRSFLNHYTTNTSIFS